MRLPTLLPLAAFAAVTALGVPALAASSQGNSSQDPSRQDSSLSYVALGDSYAAGNGSSQPIPEDECRRTTNGYPQRVADGLEAATGGEVVLDLQACSGATTTSVVTGVDESPGVNGEPRTITGPRQLEALGPDTDVVTITVGAGDVDIEGVLNACVAAPTSCESLLAAASERYDGDELVDLVTSAVQAIQGGEGGSRPAVVVTGYPTLVDVEAVTTGQCAASAGVPGAGSVPPELLRPVLEAVAAVAESTARLNADLAAATAAAAAQVPQAEVRFVDVDPAFQGHRICDEEPWIVVPSPAVSDRFWFHPNDAGHQAIAESVLAALEGLALADEPGATPTSDDGAVPPGVSIPTAVPAGG